MPPTCSICRHAKRADIDLAIVRGTSLRDIAAQFGVSHNAVGRHKTKCVAEQIERAEKIVRARQPAPVSKEAERAAVRIVEARDAQALDVMTELRRIFDRMNKMLAACDAWLTDVDDPDRYDIGPRAHELSVTYEDVIDGDDGPITLRRKAKLSDLLAEVKGERPRTFTMVETKSADPRDLIVKVSAQLKGQIELLAKLLGELSDAPTINIVMSPEWVALRRSIQSALIPYPEALAAVVTAVRPTGGAHV